METRRNVPPGRLTLAGTVGALSSKAPLGRRGQDWGKTSNELRKAGTKAKRDDLISQPQRNKAPTSPLRGRLSLVLVFVTTA